MPVFGLTTIQAVNRLLRAINVMPVSALDPSGVGGTSIQARAQEVLEETLLTKLIAGTEENTVDTVLQLDSQVTTGLITAGAGAITAAVQPVITSNGHVVTTAQGVRFLATDSIPALSGPYAVSAVGANTITLAAGQVTTTTAGTKGAYIVMSRITLPADTLRVIPFGMDDHRTFAFNASTNRLIDIDNGNTEFFESPVSVRRIFNKAFETCTPALKEAVANEAAQIFQRRYRGNPEQDQYLAGEAIKTEVVVKRPANNAMPVNQTPLGLSVPAPSQG